MVVEPLRVVTKVASAHCPTAANGTVSELTEPVNEALLFTVVSVNRTTLGKGADPQKSCVVATSVESPSNADRAKESEPAWLT
jgi:hypothetical protein